MSKRSHAIVVDARMIDHETFFLSKSDSISAIRFLTNRYTSRRNAVRRRVARFSHHFVRTYERPCGILVTVSVTQPCVRVRATK